MEAVRVCHAPNKRFFFGFISLIGHPHLLGSTGGITLSVNFDNAEIAVRVHRQL